MAGQHRNDRNELQADQGSAGAALSAAGKQAQRAMDGAKGLVGNGDLDELGAKAADVASALYRSGSDLIANSEELSQAKTELSEAIRKNPLAAVGIAFAAGLVLALLTR